LALNTNQPTKDTIQRQSQQKRTDS
jgi:hypothetical protein